MFRAFDLSVLLPIISKAQYSVDLSNRKIIVTTKVHSTQDIVHSISNHKETLKCLGVHSIGLFGSFVKNSVHEDSDVDLLVDFYPNMKSFDNYMELVFFLEELFGRKVEIVTRQSLSKYIGPHILKEVVYVFQS